jgi:hypothetical protein
MADSASTAPPTADVANLHLDEVTGEKVSKSELKKRQKLRQKDAEKASRAAAAPPKAVKKTNAEADEKELNPNVGVFVTGRSETLKLTVPVAIFRDQITNHQQASGVQESISLSTQVPSHYRLTRLCQGSLKPQVRREQEASGGQDWWQNIQQESLGKQARLL